MAKTLTIPQRRRRFYKLLTGNLRAMDSHLHQDRSLFPTYVVGLARWAALTAIQRLGPDKAMQLMSDAINAASLEFKNRLEEVNHEL